MAHQNLDYIIAFFSSYMCYLFSFLLLPEVLISCDISYLTWNLFVIPQHQFTSSEEEWFLLNSLEAILTIALRKWLNTAGSFNISERFCLHGCYPYGTLDLTRLWVAKIFLDLTLLTVSSFTSGSTLFNLVFITIFVLLFSAKEYICFFCVLEKPFKIILLKFKQRTETILFLKIMA